MIEKYVSNENGDYGGLNSNLGVLRSSKTRLGSNDETLEVEFYDNL